MSFKREKKYGGAWEAKAIVHHLHVIKRHINVISFWVARMQINSVITFNIYCSVVD